MTNEQLVIRIKAGENTADNMAQLYDQVKGFICSIAWRYKGQEELEDLEQEGYLALYDAIDGYDPDLGYKFLTYAEKWIKQRIQRYIAGNACCLRLSFHEQERLKKYKRLCDSYMKEYDREPSEWEAAAHLGLSIDQVMGIKRNACIASLGSLDAPVKGLEEDGITVGDGVPSHENMEEAVLDKVEHEELQTVLWDLVNQLPGRQPEVIKSRYQEGKTLEAISQRYGVSREVIRQDEAKALRKLRKPKRTRVLKPFLPEADRIYSMGITGNGVDRFNRTWTSSTERAALSALEWEEEIKEHERWMEEMRALIG